MLSVKKAWGTWEELVLGGAVLRHGTRDWDAVASELRTRTLYPYIFTPEVCKAKYEDLQHRYSGCKAWFEELRKQRVAELKRALEQSEDSIGSLESKLKTLNADKGDSCCIDYNSSQMESAVPFQKSEGIESSGKDTSKDGLSAGSFTQETRTNWLPECRLPPTVLAEETETKPEVLESSKREKASESSERERFLESAKQAKFLGIEKLTENICGGQMQGVRKRRGKRKRKDCNRNKEGIIGEGNILGSVNVTNASQWKESSMRDSAQIARAPSIIGSNVGLSRQGIDDLMAIFDTIMKNENASMFRHRLDSQKKRRYKKLVRRHMDFDTIRFRISNRSITSAKELFRDLLLLTNNALVFYSKKSHEYKSAMHLRDLVTRTLRQQCKDPSKKAVSTGLITTSPLCNPPGKPRSIRPRKHKLSGKGSSTVNVVSGNSQSGRKPSSGNPLPMVELVPAKGLGKQGKVGRGTAGRQAETLAKGRKRTRGR
ncbi:uncharacterized protein LOC131153631 isoform X2 [Malania oleifera]|uniref:uncharacterized protein LOC131153631 isoform X2 n=1 Tax=Malania oleifera TaxID=397392 RepID=UPI0025AE17E8|nr:uncharacterized protein LOC131153631 isoform X2 [Malania oleifera]